jgi:hypothetical protein
MESVFESQKLESKKKISQTRADTNRQFQEPHSKYALMCIYVCITLCNQISCIACDSNIKYTERRIGESRINRSPQSGNASAKHTHHYWTFSNEVFKNVIL